MFENLKKVSFNIASEASYVYILSNFQTMWSIDIFFYFALLPQIYQELKVKNGISGDKVAEKHATISHKWEGMQIKVRDNYNCKTEVKGNSAELLLILFNSQRKIQGKVEGKI